MAVSGTNTFNLNRNEIIIKAYQLLGIATEGRSLTNYEVQLAVDVLNMMIKEWADKGRYLWKAHQGTLFLVYGQAEYVIDGASSNIAYTDQYVQTSLSNSINSPSTSIEVDTVTGMTIGDYIGIYLTNTDSSTNYLFWTTITAIDSGTLTVTIADSIPYDADSGNVVFAYPINVERPLAISQTYVQYTDSNSRYPMEVISREEYFEEITQPTTISRPQELYYELELTDGKIFLWPTPSDVTQVVGFTFDQMFFDVGSATDNLDFPVEWLKAIYYNLAADLADFYGIGAERLSNLQQKAASLFQSLKGYDRERYTSLYFRPDDDR